MSIITLRNTVHFHSIPTIHRTDTVHCITYKSLYTYKHRINSDHFTIPDHRTYKINDKDGSFTAAFLMNILLFYIDFQLSHAESEGFFVGVEIDVDPAFSDCASAVMHLKHSSVGI